MPGKKGPTKITFKLSIYRMGFYAKNNCIEFKLTRNKTTIYNCSLKDAQIRRLRSWLNWFLDNK